MKEIKMLDFLCEHQNLHGRLIIEVLSATLLDYDSDYGYAGEAYLVKLVEVIGDNTTHLDCVSKKVSRTCIVNALEYNNWVRKKEIIKFID